jgi:riboflavin synthase
VGSEQKDNSNKLEHCREADFGHEVEEFMREERKRKDAENLADDLFNAERLKRQMAAKPKPRQQGKTLA